MCSWWLFHPSISWNPLTSTRQSWLRYIQTPTSALSLALGLHLVVFVSLQESIIWHGALTGSKWGYPPWPNGKTCCLLGWKVREHECISLFPVLLFPLIWSIRLGTHTHIHSTSASLYLSCSTEQSHSADKSLWRVFRECSLSVIYWLYVSWNEGMTSLFVALLFFSLTINGCSFGKDGDGSLGHSLLANHGGDFGPPAVWTHPQEVTCLVAPFGCIQNSSDQEKKKESIVCCSNCFF